MAKKSRKRPPRSEKYDAGCMWGLINIFDLRQGDSATKLLSDRKRRSGRHLGTRYSRSKLDSLGNSKDKQEADDVDESRGENVNLSTTTVRILMEEEISRARPSKKIPSEEIDRIRSELGLSALATTDFKVVSGPINDLTVPTSLESQQFNCMNLTEMSPLSLDLAPFMLKFYDGTSPVSETVDQYENQVMLHKALIDDAADVFVNQKFINVKNVSAAVHSQEFMEALESGRSGRLEEPVSHKLCSKQGRCRLFTKKNKSNGTKPSITNIVVLKPNSSLVPNSSIPVSPSPSPHRHHSMKWWEDSERVTSHLSFREIKRRFRHVISNSRKEGDVISMDGILHRIPYGSKDSGDPGQHWDGVTYYNAEYEANKPKERQQNTKSKNNFLVAWNEKRANKTATAHPLNGKSFYEEAKKHLAQMLSTRHSDDILEKKSVSKPLGTLLSTLEGNISPRLSPLMPDAEAKMIDANPEFIGTQVKEGICTVECLNQKVVKSCSGITEIVEKADITPKKECEDEDSKPDGHEEGSPAQSGLGPPEESSPDSPCLCFSLSSLERNNKNRYSILEKPEQPSPISVLEPFFSEDANITESELDMHTESPICPRCIYFEDSEDNPRTCMNDNAVRSEFIRAVLELSGFSCNGISNRWLSPYTLLDPSLLDELEISYSHLPDDPKLIFDCIHEDLVEIQERLFSCSPWVSVVRPNARPMPVGENLIQEVCRGIERHLEWESPRTLDQIVGKDMDAGAWVEIRPDIQSIVVEIGDSVMEELMVETALEMWLELSILRGTSSFCS